MRNKGKTHSMILGMIPKLQDGEGVSVGGCKDPNPIINRLAQLGVKVKAKPMIVTQPLKAIYKTDGFEEYIAGFTGGEKKQTGFIFYLINKTMKTFEVDKNIPIPPKLDGRKQNRTGSSSTKFTRTIRIMDVGDSFEVEKEKSDIMSTISRMRRKESVGDFTIRKTGNNKYRIWKIQ